MCSSRRVLKASFLFSVLSGQLLFVLPNNHCETQTIFLEYNFIKVRFDQIIYIKKYNPQFVFRRFFLRGVLCSIYLSYVLPGWSILYVSVVHLFYFFPLSCASRDIFVFLCAAKPLFNGALWATQLWPLKRLRTSTVIHAAFTADARASKTSSILSYLLRTLSSLMGSLAILLIECHSGQHQS